MRTVSMAGHDGFKVGQAARKSAQRLRAQSRAQNDAHVRTEVAFVLRFYRIVYGNMWYQDRLREWHG